MKAATSKRINIYLILKVSNWIEKISFDLEKKANYLPLSESSQKLDDHNELKKTVEKQADVIVIDDDSPDVNSKK